MSRHAFVSIIHTAIFLFPIIAIAQTEETTSEEYRTWNGTDDRLPVEAVLAGFSDGKAQLKLRDGTIISVRPQELSGRDKSRLALTLKMRRKEKDQDEKQSSTTQESLSEDFSTDPRTKYGMDGEITWKPGQITFAKDASWDLHLTPSESLDMTFDIEPVSASSDDYFSASSALQGLAVGDPAYDARDNLQSNIQITLRRRNGQTVLLNFGRSKNRKDELDLNWSIITTRADKLLVGQVPRRFRSRNDDGTINIGMKYDQKKASWNISYKRGRLQLRRNKVLLAYLELNDPSIPFTGVNIERANGKIDLSRLIATPGLRGRSASRQPSRPLTENVTVDDLKTNPKSRYAFDGQPEWKQGQLSLHPEDAITFEWAQPVSSATVALDFTIPNDTPQFALFLTMTNGDKWGSKLGRKSEDGVDVHAIGTALITNQGESGLLKTQVPEEFATTITLSNVDFDAFEFIEDPDSAQWIIRYDEGHLQLHQGETLLCSYQYPKKRRISDPPKLVSIKLSQVTDELSVTQIQVTPNNMITRTR